MEKSEELRKQILDWYKNYLNPNYYENSFTKSPEVLVIGTDETEWITGFEKVVASMKKQVEVLPDAKFVKFDPNVYVEGSVGWFNDNVIASVNNSDIKMRMTGVLHKEGEKWKIVQAHVSIGIPNAQTGFGDVNIVE